jgi:hypothetical protein
LEPGVLGDELLLTRASLLLAGLEAVHRSFVFGLVCANERLLLVHVFAELLKLFSGNVCALALADEAVLCAVNGGRSWSNTAGAVSSGLLAVRSCAQAASEMLLQRALSGLDTLLLLLKLLLQRLRASLLSFELAAKVAIVVCFLAA